MAYKIGDTVTIRKDISKLEDSFEVPYTFGISSDMMDYAGRTATITNMRVWGYCKDGRIYSLSLDDGYWDWISECFEDDKPRLVL